MFIFVFLLYQAAGSTIISLFCAKIPPEKLICKKRISQRFMNLAEFELFYIWLMVGNLFPSDRRTYTSFVMEIAATLS